MMQIETMLIGDVNYDFKNTCIRITECNLIELFRSVAIMYILDFPKGQIRPDGKIYTKYSTGVWEDYIDDYSVFICRKKYRLYEMEIGKDSKNAIIKRGHKTKKIKLNGSDLVGLANEVKSTIVKNGQAQLISEISKSYLWGLTVPQSEAEALALIQKGAFEL